MNSKRLMWFKRITLFIIGQFILALGIAFSVRSNLGVSPVTSVPFVFSLMTGWTLGTTTVIIYLICMVLQAAVLRRDYNPINLLQIAVSFLFGYFTDATLWLTSILPAQEIFAVRFIYLAAGIACIALGVLFYLTTSLLALPTDGTVQAIAYKGHFKLHKVKIGYDTVSTALAILMSLVFLRRIEGIGIGTILAAFGVGKMLGVFTTLLKKHLIRFLGMPAGAEVDASIPAGVQRKEKPAC